MKQLKDTKWLAARLGVSKSAIEKLRAYQPEALPAHVRIGRSVRYDEQTVEQWIMSNMEVGV